MIFRETTQADLDFMADNTISRGVQKSDPGRTSYVYTLEREGEILGVGGFRLITPTTAWCWVDLTHLAGKYIITGMRILEEQINKFVKEHNLRRLQAYVQHDFPEAIRLIEYLGFEKEFEKPMKNFVDDKDAYMYIRLF